MDKEEEDFVRKELALNSEEYYKRKEHFEKEYFNKYVVFYKQDFKGVFDDFDKAGRFAVENYGRGPYLIRKVGREGLSFFTRRFACLSPK